MSSPSTKGVTIALYGDTGTGKTTQIGEYAKWRMKEATKTTCLVTADLGGYQTLNPHVSLGFVRPIPILNGADDPWVEINDAVEGRFLEPTDGVVAFDSGTSMGEKLLSAITKDPRQIGQQKTQRFTVASKDGRALQVGANNESHYGLVQGFLLDAIWRSTFLVEKGVDVIWTFSLDRSEKTDAIGVVGPKLAGHALTASIPKWFLYTFRLVSTPVAGAPPRHSLYLQEQPDLGGVGMSFANARYPLDAEVPLPAVVEPASVVEALRLIQDGERQAKEAIMREVGL